MSISIERRQAINEMFTEKVKEHQLEEYEHLFVSPDFIHSFAMLFNRQNKRFAKAIKSEKTEKLFKELNKYTIIPDSFIRKTEYIIETFTDKRIWSNEDKIYQHIALHP